MFRKCRHVTHCLCVQCRTLEVTLVLLNMTIPPADSQTSPIFPPAAATWLHCECFKVQH